MIELHRILSVDDSDADQYLHRMRISKLEGVELREAYDGVEALEILAEPGYVPDLILLDINMPRMDGFSFLEAFSRDFPDRPAPIIVVLTSSTLDTDRSRANEFDIVRGYLVKPLGENWLAAIEAAIAAPPRERSS